MTEPITKITANDLKKIDPSRILNLNVGVLGHVDSGKTSLVKTLSTLLSTASLDKSSQSRQRGITLDLGFSAFIMPLPPSITDDKELTERYDLLQVTLVDCPGHASLIRTIIGGAQIIDMVLLVMDATKGIQTQTAECLVIAEMTTKNLVIVLNKIDLIPEEERDQKLAQTEKRIRSALKGSRFEQAAMIGISACVGGEKVAAASEDAQNHNSPPTTMNVKGLVDLLHAKIQPPNRDQIEKSAFHFAIDHCFPIKGQGTVITGTCLAGSVKVKDMIEFPTLSLQRQVKSMQMFRRKVTEIKQGDRAGLCVANLDSKMMERGVASSIDSVKLISGAIAVVKKVNYFRQTLSSGTKFHVSVGHTTVMATITFFGAREIASKLAIQSANNDNRQAKEIEEGSAPKLSGHADIAGFPRIKFDFNEDFLQQDGYIETLDEGKPDGCEVPLHWAIIDFQTPVYCPLDSLVIGSRLDTDIQANTCRLAFSGRLVQKFDASADMKNINFYTKKERAGVVDRLGDPFKRDDDGKTVRYEIYGNDLFRKETNMNEFIGLHLETEKGEIGVIQSSFGTSGKFRMNFPAGTTVRNGDKLFLRFKRYLNDRDKKIRQDSILPTARVGTRIESEPKKTKKKKINVIQDSPDANGDSQGPTIGRITNVKGDATDDGLYNMVIVEGFFTPEVNIREKIGTKVRVIGRDEEGSIAGSFGKAGKCKVSFIHGISKDRIGTKTELVE